MDQEVRRRIFLAKLHNAVLDAADTGATVREVLQVVTKATNEERDKFDANHSSRY